MASGIKWFLNIKMVSNCFCCPNGLFVVPFRFSLSQKCSGSNLSKCYVIKNYGWQRIDIEEEITTKAESCWNWRCLLSIISRMASYHWIAHLYFQLVSPIRVFNAWKNGFDKHGYNLKWYSKSYGSLNPTICCALGVCWLCLVDEQNWRAFPHLFFRVVVINNAVNDK